MEHGVESMTSLAQALMTDQPDMAFIALDITNAFNMTSRASIVTEVFKHIKVFIHSLRQMWGSSAPTAWIQAAPGEWLPQIIIDGILQGELRALLLFA